MQDHPSTWLIGLLAAAVGVGGGGKVAYHYHSKRAYARIVVNGIEIFNGKALFCNDRVMFPAIAAHRAGVVAYWDGTHKILLLRNHNADENVAVRPGCRLMICFLSDGDRWLRHEGGDLGLPFDPLRVKMETQPILRKGRVMLPIRVIAATLCADPYKDVRWDAKRRIVFINLPETGMPLMMHNPGKPAQSFVAPQWLVDEFDQYED